MYKYGPMTKRSSTNQHIPLASRMRPVSFDTFVGQKDIVGEGMLLRTLIEHDQLSSLVLWGPPGVGKTTLAHIVAHQTDAEFVFLSAVESGKRDLMKAVKEAKSLMELAQKKTVLFVDEIHRWSKAQQDALLPYVERGDIILIGATTENPSFEIIAPLLSRSRVFILKHLETEDLVELLRFALADKENGFGNIMIDIADDVLELLAGLSSGDARAALNGLELAVKSKTSPASSLRATSTSPKRRGDNVAILLTLEDIKEALQRTHLVFDKKGEEFYNLISALHKSMRGSDANASLYWLARMIEGGADPLYIARRVLRFACEDIGMANSEALIQCDAAYDACHKLGFPECNVHLAQAVVYCAKAKKSNVLYTAYGAAARDARNTSELGVPLHLRNAPTKFMKRIGYGKDYKYNPDHDGSVEQDYLPDELRNKKYLK